MRLLLIQLFFLFLPFCLLARASDVRQQAQSHTFLENKGQITDQHHHPRNDIQFKLSVQGMNVFIGNGQIHYQWNKFIDDKAPKQEEDFLHRVDLDNSKTEQKFETYRLDVILLNANLNAEIIKEEQQDYYENYYLPQCPNGAIAHSFRKITYKNIYPNIDWVIYITPTGDGIGSMKYDFIVHPGGNPNDIQVQYNGATSLRLHNGTVIANTPFGSVTENAPYTYESKKGKAITSKFVLRDNILSFDVEKCTGTLVIDPQLEWATYYGGATSENIGTNGLCVDKLGFMYLSGNTSSLTNIATLGAHLDTLGGQTDGFVVKFSTIGQRQWATYYGGTNNETLSSIVADNNDDILLAGATSSSSGIATPGAHQVLLEGGSGGWRIDGFIVKLNSTGVRIWGTYFGGNSGESINSISVNKNNSFFIVGNTSSKNGIVTPGCHQESLIGNNDAFIAMFDSYGTLKWATYYGGDSYRNDAFTDVVCDNSGYIFATGYTSSTGNIATPGTHQSILKDSSNDNGFLVKFDTFGKRIWGTYYGSGGTTPWAIEIDGINNIYIGGDTRSFIDIATPGSFQQSLGGDNDMFLSKFDSSGKLRWGTYYGGDRLEHLHDMTIDNRGDLSLVGCTDSRKGIATLGAWRQHESDTLIFRRDGSFIKFDTSGNLLWGTYYGDKESDHMYAVCTDVSDNIILGGYSYSVNNIATAGAFQVDNKGDADAFLIKSLPDSLVFVGVSDSVHCIDKNDSIIRVEWAVSRSFYSGNVFTIQLSDTNGSFISPVVIGSKATTGAGVLNCKLPPTIQLAKGYRIRVVSSAPFYISNDNGVDIAIKDGPEKPVATGDTLLCAGSTLHLSATCSTPGVQFIWSGPGAFSATVADTTRDSVIVSHSGDYVVTVTPPECKISDTVQVNVLYTPAKPIIKHNAPVCVGDTFFFSFKFDTSANTFYTWSWPTTIPPGQNNEVDSVTLDYSGEYIVVANNYGCISRDTAYVFIDDGPELTAENNGPLFPGDMLELKAASDSAVSYLWEGPGGFMSNEQNPVIQDFANNNLGIYTVWGTNARGCRGASYTTVLFKELGNDFVLLFPNANNGHFTIQGQFSRADVIRMKVVNIVGQLVYSDKIDAAKGAFSHTVTLPAVANGKYIVYLSANNKVTSIPFVVGK